MIAVFNSSRKSEASRLAQYLAAYYELSAWGLYWVRTGHAQHIQVFSAGSIFSSSCFLTWPRSSTLIHPPLYGYMLQSPTSTRAESAGISPPRPAAYFPCECALQSSQRFTSPTQIPQLPQKQYNKEPSETSQRDLLLIFSKEFCTQESPTRGMKRCPCAYKLHHGKQEERHQRCTKMSSQGSFQQ